ncbi:MAG: DNA polymerase I [Lachnospiraceae bacterium]|nr:DNA polymerase I [Lachnospiraceae bacterium]
MSEKIVLIDGHSILNRAFFGIPDLTNGEGLHTNAVYGFINIMLKILDEEQPQYLTVAFDVHAPTFRHKMYEAYKGTRKPMAEELRQQVPLMKEMLHAMGVNVIEQEGLEADDLLGTLAKRAECQGLEVSIVSGDRDLLQLATEHTKIRIPKTKRTGTEIEDYYAKDVLERYQVTPTQFIDVKALMGDTADNIPGVPGIGEKTATSLIVTYGSIENAYEHVEEIKPNRAKTMLSEHYDMARMSKELATIKVDADVPFELSQASYRNLFTQDAYLMCKRLEFKNLLKRFELNADETGNAIENSFCLLTELQDVERLLVEAKECDTIGLQLVMESGALLGAAISLSEEKTAFVLVQGFVTEAYLMEQIHDLLKHGVCIATFDLKPQLRFLTVASEGIIDDVKIAAYLLNPLKNEYSYEDIAKDYLGMMIPSAADLLGKMSLTKAVEENPEAVQKTCCYQAYVNRKSKEALINELKSQGMEELYRDIEMPLVYTLYDMELEGIGIDAVELKEYGENLAVSIERLEQEIYEEAGETFNIQSPKQLGVILFEKLKMPNGKKTKTGYSTAADVLEKLAPDYPIVSKILEYRQLAKLKSTYADGLAAYIDADGRIRSTFQQTVTATGRLSSTEPNLQNIPIRMELGRLIRKVFYPREGYVFVDADYSQIELRVLAHMSGDDNLIDAYRQAQDIHAITASKVFHVPFEEVTPLQRRNAKAVNFGIVYGISSFGLSQDLSITKKEADAYIKSYFETYPGIKEFLDRQVEEGKRDGYVKTMFGRRRPVPELSSSNFMQRSFGERVAMNAPIQGTAADIIKIAMIRVHNRLKDEKLKSKLILQVHDELLVEAAEDEVEQVCSILEEEMKHAAELSVVLEIDMHTGKNWYEAK